MVSVGTGTRGSSLVPLDVLCLGTSGGISVVIPAGGGGATRFGTLSRVSRVAVPITDAFSPLDVRCLVTSGGILSWEGWTTRLGTSGGGVPCVVVPVGTASSGTVEFLVLCFGTSGGGVPSCAAAPVETAVSEMEGWTVDSILPGILGSGVP